MVDTIEDIVVTLSVRIIATRRVPQSTFSVNQDRLEIDVQFFRQFNYSFTIVRVNLILDYRGATARYIDPCRCTEDSVRAITCGQASTYPNRMGRQWR